MRLRVLALMMGLVLALAGTVVAQAGETWCDTDPPVMVTTPAGHTVVVFVNDSGPAEDLVALLTPTIDQTVKAVAHDTATQVALTVTIADLNGRHDAVHSEVWTGPLRTGQLLASADGQAGSPLSLNFRLNVP